ncbi:MAG: NAD(P)H-binding protein [Saccharospirillaceae bacterium]|nr:NAD(P)H-binding protein [Pseudomonadales bacterium]NRB80558.1 NAD(P)H-binding protein [Saccharospirillaceae bacterium]
MNILILGATGLVGNDCLTILQNQSNIDLIICPTRRKLQPHLKLINPDFNTWLNDIKINPHILENIDAVICCLGSTIKLARSKENFKQIDHGLVIKIASICKQVNVKSFAYNSSIGANIHSKQLYIYTKALVEKELTDLNFEKLTIVRPSLLSGQSRPEFRLGEWISIQLTKVLNPIIPKKYRSIKTQQVAKVLCAYSTQAINNTNQIILESDQLQDFI